ncbi:hypothetical protein QUC31_018935 [Theobroma cacao]
MQQDLPTRNNMTTPDQNFASKPVVAPRVPTLSFMSNDKPSFGHDQDQVKSLHDESCKGGYKVEDGCNKGSSSVLVPRGHASDGNDAVEALQKDSGRERLKRHREEVAGRVLIPDKWGKEELLKDWIDYPSFDSLLAPNGLASARKALMMEGRRNGSQRLRIQSMC